MRLVLDSGASQTHDDEELLTARAYVASVVGPRRAPQGRSKSVVGPVTNALVARNDTPNRVLFVTASCAQVGTATFSKTPGGASIGTRFDNNAGLSLPNSVSFILYPSEELYVTTGITALSIFESRF